MMKLNKVIFPTVLIIVILNMLISFKIHVELSAHARIIIMIFTGVNSILILYLVYIIFNRYSYSILSLVAFGIITNFTLSTSVGTTLLLLLTITYRLWESRLKYGLFILTLLVGLMAMFIYPSSVIFFSLIFIPYIFIYKDHLASKLYRDKKHFYIIIIISLGIISFFIVTLVNNFQIIAESLIITKNQLLNSPLSYNIVIFIFSIFGILYTLLRNKNKLLFVWFILSFIQVYIYTIFKFTMFIPFDDIFMFSLVCQSMLSGIGASTLIQLIRLILKKKIIILTLNIIIIFIFILPYVILLLNTIK